MDANFIKSNTARLVFNELEVLPQGDGFLVWMPLRHSDGDAICLSVRPHAGGWAVSDDGSTYGLLCDLNAEPTAPKAHNAWMTLARPGSGFIIGDEGDYEAITAVGTEEDIPRLLLDVSTSAVRAAGVEFLGRERSSMTFAQKVSARVTSVVEGMNAPGRVVRPRGGVPLSSGRSRTVTAIVEYNGAVDVAIQALGGGSRDNQSRSHDTCYSIFSPSSIDKTSRIALAAGREEAWDSYMLKELRDVCTVAFWDDASEIRSVLARAMGVEGPPILV